MQSALSSQSGKLAIRGMQLHATHLNSLISGSGFRTGICVLWLAEECRLYVIPSIEKWAGQTECLSAGSRDIFWFPPPIVSCEVFLSSYTSSDFGLALCQHLGACLSPGRGIRIWCNITYPIGVLDAPTIRTRAATAGLCHQWRRCSCAKVQEPCPTAFLKYRIELCKYM